MGAPQTALLALGCLISKLLFVELMSLAEARFSLIELKVIPLFKVASSPTSFPECRAQHLR
jgi:hypothetical protein